MEFDLSPYTRIGMGILAGRLIALYVSAYFVALQCFMLSIEPLFHMITVCDVYLILGWYVKMNGPTYIDGKLVTDRRIIFRERMRTRFFWDVMTLFPFEVFLVACYATLHPALSVGRSVGQSAGHVLLFNLFYSYLLIFSCVLHFFFIRDNFFELSLGVLKFWAVFSLKFS